MAGSSPTGPETPATEVEVDVEAEAGHPTRVEPKPRPPPLTGLQPSSSSSNTKENATKSIQAMAIARKLAQNRYEILKDEERKIAELHERETFRWKNISDETKSLLGYLFFLALFSAAILLLAPCI